MSQIAVIGSMNMDMVVCTSRFPKAGETISGDDFKLAPGGKGANQAVAASRSGAATSFVGCVGDDAFGQVLLDSLTKSGVDINNIRTVKELPTGTATIIVEKNGENRIIIVPGANAQVGMNDVEAALPLIKSAKIVLLQFEIPLDTVFRTIHYASQWGCKVILNAAPAYDIPSDLYQKIDFIIINENEAAFLSSIKVTDGDSAIRAARILLEKGVKNVIVTLGEQGAVLVMPDEHLYAPAIPVKVIDTTAAGDSFVGAFAAALVNGSDLKSAVQYAVAAGCLAVTKLGAQPSIPTRQEIKNFL